MRRLLLAATIGLVLGGCDFKQVTGTGGGTVATPRYYLPLYVEPSGRGILSLDDSHDVNYLLQSILAHQQSMAGVQRAFEWARDITGAQRKPDVIDMEISSIILPEDGQKRSNPNPADVVVASFLDALMAEGITYAMQGDQTSLEERYNLIKKDGDEVEVTLLVKQYTLVHKQ
jgi:hypothetical protein